MQLPVVSWCDSVEGQNKHTEYNSAMLITHDHYLRVVIRSTDYLGWVGRYGMCGGRNSSVPH